MSSLFAIQVNAQYKVTVAKDGSFTYSATIAVNGGQPETFLVYPNPAKNSLQLLHDAAGKNTVIKIFTANGKLKFQQNVKQASRQTEMNISAFPSGNYFVQIIAGTRVIIHHFTKQ